MGDYFINPKTFDHIISKKRINLIYDNAAKYELQKHSAYIVRIKQLHVSSNICNSLLRTALPVFVTISFESPTLEKESCICHHLFFCCTTDIYTTI